MKYRDLIQFEPVVDIIQLRQADERIRAEKLVSTYVISDRMTDVILHRILPSLRFDSDKPGDGLFVVGNYGTGKSHLMSIVTAIAEHAGMLHRVTHPAVGDGLKPIAGKFKVVRQETGSTEKNLRDIVLEDLEKHLKRMGVDFHFPPMDQAASNKELIVEMMVVFKQKYPDFGLLVAMDELLDYLRGRKDQQLVLDLNFLREIGEACELTPFRFMAGIQESLFDSPRFQFAADSIRRVKARFEQVRIVREDMAYVVSRRLLAKTEAEKKQVRKHLEKFTNLYAAMAEHLDDYVDLYPIHPAYLEVFEEVTVVEKRDLLKALSKQMESLLDQDVPVEQTGLISFDSYWTILNDEPSYRSVPEIRDVQDKARVLSDRVRTAPNIKDYRPAALRIIAALAVHRLTLSDLYAPIGLTPAELRDRLSLYLPIPEMDADFLLTTVETVLIEISRAVNGQFISHNRENDQYYLDLKKDIDYDALIDQRAASLDDAQLDRYFFDMLARGLELTDSTYVPGFRIWQRELPWTGQGMTRKGYIFLGAPYERSTAQPERDFYLHFLPPFTVLTRDLGNKPDEVFFAMAQRDAVFIETLRRYAGTREMSSISSGSNKEQYERKADGFMRTLNNWLRENITRAVVIRWKGTEMTVPEALSKHHLSIRDMSLREQLFRLASAFLGETFQQKYPNYPKFSGIDFTYESLVQAADATLRAVAGGAATRSAQVVLEGLGLARMESGQLVFATEDSPFAQHVVKMLYTLPDGKVLNRNELIGGQTNAEVDKRFGLEPEWFMVVLAALARQGEITINLPGTRIDSATLDDAARLGVNTLIKFTAVSRPKPIPEQALRALFTELGLPEDLIIDSKKLELAPIQLQATVETELNLTVRLLESMREGPRCWREPLFSAAELQLLRDELGEYKNFLSTLQTLNSPGKLRNFSTGQGDVRHIMRTRKVLADIKNLYEVLQAIQPQLEYIYQAEVNLPGDDAWLGVADQARAEQLAVLKDPAQRGTPNVVARLKGCLSNLQDAYARRYLELHTSARLDSIQDTQKKRLTGDVHWAQLRALSALEFLQRSDLQKLEDRLGALRSCPSLTINDLRQHTTCPACGYLPRTAGADGSAFAQLQKVTEDFDYLYNQWVNALISSLKSESSQKNLPMLREQEREYVTTFIGTGQLPDRMNDRMVGALRDTLHGLEIIDVDGTDLLLALTRPGMPCTPEDFDARYRSFMAKHLQGKDPAKARIRVEW
ncbi:MAG: DUF6079 family protein [Chloroflexota bacterium]